MMTPSRPTSGPFAAVWWCVVFATVVSHLPAVGFDFAGRDFDGLARAAGILPVSGWIASAFGEWIVWAVQWPVLGTSAVGYHGTALVALALLTGLVARVAVRSGGTAVAAAIAGLWMLLGPSTWVAVAWVSAAAQTWAMVFAVLAFDLWTDPRGGARPLLAGLCALVAPACAPLGAIVFLLLLLLPRDLVADETRDARRARWMLVVVAAIAAVANLVPRAPTALAALREPLVLGAAALQTIADASWPYAQRLEGPLAIALGAFVSIALTAFAVGAWRRRETRVVAAVLWFALSILLAALFGDRATAAPALGAKVAIAWLLAGRLAPTIERILGRGPDAMRRRGAALAGASIVVTVLATLGVQHVTHARGSDGRLVQPVLHATSITADVRAQLVAMRRVNPTDQVLVLQAARVELPPDLDVPESTEIVLATPVHRALRGDRGLRVLLGPDVDARWITHLDDARPNATILLDVNDDRLRVLGPVENARIYSGLIAVAAGQFARARHDLWNCIRMQGAQVRFAFDPDSLPITPEELDAEASAFAQYLAAQDEASSLRVLRLFEQIYEEVRGRELIRDLDEPLRAPRRDH